MVLSGSKPFAEFRCAVARAVALEILLASEVNSIKEVGQVIGMMLEFSSRSGTQETKPCWTKSR